MGILQVSTRLFVPYCQAAHSNTSSVVPPSHINSIASPSNPFVKHCVKLRQSSSYRHSSGSALVVGLSPIREISRFQELKEDGTTIMGCLLLLDGVEAPAELLKSFGHVVHVSATVMKKLAGVESIDSIEAVAVMSIPSRFKNINNHQDKANFEAWFSSPHRILVLDRIQDPGNVGTLLRTAMAFRWDGVFLLPGCCDPFNEKALRAARGASFQLHMVSGNWDHLENLKYKFHMKMLGGHPGNSEGRTPVLLSQELADSLADDHLCLVLGSEGQGLSETAKESCELVSIPMAGKFESLNVSVAGGIFLFLLQPQNQRPCVW